MKKTTESLIDQLVQELGGPILDAVPEGAVSPAMLAKASGLGERTAWKKLDDKVKAGRLRKIQVRIPGYSKPQPYFVAA